MPLAVGLLVVVLGLGFWMTGPGRDPAPSPPAVTAVQQSRTLALSAADINWAATRMAQELIRSGKIKPAPVAAAAATQTVAPSDAAGAQPSTPPAAASPATVAPEPSPPAPVVHPVKRPPPPDPQPAAAQPEPAPQTAPPAPDAQPVVDAPPVDLTPAVVALVEQAPEEVRQDIVSGRQVIYNLHLLDNMSEDGDQVAVTVNGTSYGTVTLTNTGQDLLIPLVAGATASVKAAAVYDGGGGVTFGAYSSMGELRSRVMSVGESDDWSVTVQ